MVWNPVWLDIFNNGYIDGKTVIFYTASPLDYAEQIMREAKSIRKWKKIKFKQSFSASGRKRIKTIDYVVNHIELSYSKTPRISVFDDNITHWPEFDDGDTAEEVTETMIQTQGIPVKGTTYNCTFYNTIPFEPPCIPLDTR